MVATIAAGTSVGYYLAQSEYYLGGAEPSGTWVAAGDGFGIAAGATVERDPFERLHAATDAGGHTPLSNGSKRIDRVPGYDMTFSAAKSVSLLWAFSDEGLREKIEMAQAGAVQAAIGVLERNAAVSRRGRNGLSSETVRLAVAAFQHGEARPTEYADGRVFADPQLHIHAVILNLARRADGTIGTLDGRRLFAWKMTAGAAYHLALASGLQRLGCQIADIGKNGTFEVAGVDAEVKEYFSARRAEVEEALDEAGLTSAAAPALASAITKTSRAVKEPATGTDRFALWKMIAGDLGHEANRLVERVVRADLDIVDAAHAEATVRERRQAIPEQLTQTESVFERRHVMAAVASTLVGSGASVERTEQEAQALVEGGSVVELGAGAAGEMRYSTPEMIRIEREILAMTQDLSARPMLALDRNRVDRLIDDSSLSN